MLRSGLRGCEGEVLCPHQDGDASRDCYCVTAVISLYFSKGPSIAAVGDGLVLLPSWLDSDTSTQSCTRCWRV